MIALVSQKAGIVFSVRGNRLLDCLRCLRAFFRAGTNFPEPFQIQLLYGKCHVPSGNQQKLFRIRTCVMQRDDFGDRQISVTNDKLLARSHPMEERAQPVLQVRNIHRPHMAIIARSVEHIEAYN